MTLEAIKKAITELPEAERIALTDWLSMQDADAWDRQIEADFSEGGAGMVLFQRWDAEIQNGQSMPLKEFLQRLK